MDVPTCNPLFDLRIDTLVLTMTILFVMVRTIQYN